MRLLFVLAIACASLIEVQTLICKRCSGSSCNPTNITCAATTTRCQTTSTILKIGILQRSTLEQGCEQAPAPVSFSSGELSFSSIIKFCTTDCCNTQLMPDPKNTTENGLTCIGCSRTTDADCTSNQSEVKCVGTENQCLSANGTQFIITPSGPIVIKGCATMNLCTGTLNLGGFLISLAGGIQCTAATAPTTTVAPTTTAAPTTTTAAATTTTAAPTTTTASSSGESNEASSNSGESSD